MNRVIAVDEGRCSAVVEPGVSYFDLYRYIQERKLKLWIDTPDPGWGSVVGNALDHGVGYTFGQYRDHFGSHCGMEVVLPNGEVMRTGMAALAKDASWADYKYGFGPYVAGLFGQSEFRHCHQDGILAHAGTRGLPPRDRASTETARHRRRSSST